MVLSAVSSCQPADKKPSDSTSVASASGGRPPAVPRNAVAAVSAAFRSHSLVAIAENHGWKEQAEFVQALIADSSANRTFNDIVVECGNARYQADVDRFLAIADLELAALKSVWRDVTSPGSCDAQQYADLFAAVRRANEQLPAIRRLRVLLGEPPINWNEVRSGTDLGRWVAQRDEHYARVVEREVLARGRKALLIMGAYHLFRVPPHYDVLVPTHGPDTLRRDGGDLTGDTGTFIARPPPSSGSAADLFVGTILERDHPGSLFIVVPYVVQGSPAAGRSVATLTDRWPVPSLAMLGGTDLGAVEAGPLFASPMLRIENGQVSTVFGNPFPGVRLEQLGDAFLYLGPPSRQTRSLVPTSTRNDTAYRVELDRRSRIMSGHPFDAEGTWTRESRLYPDALEGRGGR